MVHFQIFRSLLQIVVLCNEETKIFFHPKFGKLRIARFIKRDFSLFKWTEGTHFGEISFQVFHILHCSLDGTGAEILFHARLFP